MAEQDSAAEAPEAGGGSAVDSIGPAAAMAVGLRKARSRDKPDPTLDAFLLEQTDLVRIQKEHLHEQRALMTSRLRLGRWKDRVTLALQGLTVLVGVIIAGAVGVMAWQASQDHGLSIAPFSVPPDLAARGLTGQVVAARVLDRLAELQAQTVSARPASTYDANWGDDIKVEIPETGVSLGELNRYLRQWLGHETRITGEVVRTATGVSVTARAGAEPGRQFPGAEAETDALIGKAAEAVYATTQPYRYAVYLGSSGRQDEALAKFQWLARHGSPEDQAWAYGGWSSALLGRGDEEGIVRVVREGQRRGLPLYESSALNNLGVALNNLSRNEEMVAVSQQVLNEVRRTGRGFAGLSRDAAERNMQAVIGSHQGAVVEGMGLGGGHDLEVEGAQSGVEIRPLQADGRIRAHDIRGGLELAGPTRAAGYQPGVLRMEADLMLEDWPGAIAAGEPELAAGLADPGRSQVAIRRIAADLAVAYARAGRLAEARALIAKTPLDCDICVQARAMIAEAAGDRPGADRWFAHAARMAPSIPIPETIWGAALLARGDAEGVIAKLKAAAAKGLHYADPQELWGEALMLKRDYAGASAKFAQANGDAPLWGRDHLMWGEALMLSGRYAEARRQYEAAKALDLSKPDRAALDVLLARTARGVLHG